jgi:hypothetical protein
MHNNGAGVSIFDDLASLSTAMEKAVPSAPNRKRWQRRYVAIPWAWVTALQTTQRACTYKLAIALLYESWKRGGGQPVVISNAFAARGGVGKRAKWRALSELERRGLVRVERGAGRAPRVTPCQISGL